MGNKRKGFWGRGKLRARLIFDDGFAETPVYSIKGMVTEKFKGLNMIKLIKNLFNITNKEIIKDDDKARDDFNSDLNGLREHKRKVEFTRDETGQIVSPFRSKRKLI